MDLITLALAKKYSDSKGGYTEAGKVLLPATTATAVETVIEGVSMGLAVGETYIVNHNGTEYTLTAIDSEGYATLVIGQNCAVLDGGSMAAIVGAIGDVFSVSTAETIHPIDPKYLPGVCLPVVELSTTPGATPTALTDAETAMLKAAFDSGNFAIITLPEDMVAQPLLCCVRINADNNTPYFTGNAFIGTNVYVCSAFIQDGVGYALCGVVG